ncbi:solute carrier family 35 member F3-like [Saccostrea echinata]|uniref:solute carrier family 35 member F3-like n=1 Tax=Saccostrea echinata TaxID=191078 RepID=UPI002A8059A8|nr:solute carrier family 35 member F3-like [Saccostrea echinata]
MAGNSAIEVERSDFVTCDSATSNNEARPDSSDGESCLCRNSKSQQKYVMACVIILCLAVTWVTSTQLCQETYVPNQFHSPLLCMYFWTVWLLLFYPAYVAIELILSKGDFPVKQTLRENILIYGPYNFHPGHFAIKTITLCFLWGVTGYSYVRALDPSFLGATDISALFSTNHTFVYMLSWIVLFEKFVPLRVIALILSISGVVLFAYADGLGSHSTWGVVLAICSSSSLAVFKVLFKKWIGRLGFGQLSMFLSIMGLGNLLMLWPVIIGLQYSGVEYIRANVPWNQLFGTAALMIVFQFLSNYTECLTNELVTGLGMVVAVPMCAVSDYIWRNRHFNGMKFSGVVLSTLGLILVLMPDTCFSQACSSCVKYTHTKQTITQPERRGRRSRREISRA